MARAGVGLVSRLELVILTAKYEIIEVRVGVGVEVTWCQNMPINCIAFEIFEDNVVNDLAIYASKHDSCKDIGPS